MAKVKIGNVKGPQGEQGPQGPTGATGATGQVDASTPIAFEEHSSYANIESGESIATIFGKLKKVVGGVLAGAGSTLLGANLTADRVLLSNSDGKITASTITATELAYLDGLIGNVQQNINSLNEKMQYTRETNHESVGINSDGYGSVAVNIGSDEKIIGANIMTWGTGTLYGGPTIGSNGNGYGYILGKPNSFITNVSIRWRIVKI